MTSAYLAHPGYLALLRGVLLNPAANLPRLVLADWLEESGDGHRAAFIRDGVESGHLARFFPGIDATDVAGSLVVCPGYAGVQLSVCRGFVSGVSATVEGFTAHAAALFSAHPVVSASIRSYGGWGTRYAAEGNWPTYLFGDWPPPDLSAADRLAWESDAMVAYGRRSAGLPPVVIE